MLINSHKYAKKKFLNHDAIVKGLPQILRNASKCYALFSKSMRHT